MVCLIARRLSDLAFAMPFRSSSTNVLKLISLCHRVISVVLQFVLAMNISPEDLVSLVMLYMTVLIPLHGFCMYSRVSFAMVDHLYSGLLQPYMSSRLVLRNPMVMFYLLMSLVSFVSVVFVE